MKSAKMTINFLKDTVEILGQSFPLTVTTSGHYILPLTSGCQLYQSVKNGVNQNCEVVTFHVHSITQGCIKSLIAKKLHRQFAHASAEKLMKLIENSNSMWKDDDALKKEIVETVDKCETCKIYKKPSPTPIVGLPLATKFQETVAMDLKFYKGKIILHLIDHATRLSQAVCILSKQPKDVIKAIFDKWISVYGSTERFLSDNGGEFVNEEFLIMCEQFNITVKTTSAESPWSNGMVERHNLTLSNMLDRVLEDTNSPFDVALQWCVNAKKSLPNIHGFSPYQLALGRNPTLPSLMTDKPPTYDSQPSSEIVRANLNALHKCRQAFIESENSEKLRRAMAHNVRTSSDNIFVVGDKV